MGGCQSASHTTNATSDRSPQEKEDRSPTLASLCTDIDPHDGEPPPLLDVTADPLELSLQLQELSQKLITCGPAEATPFFSGLAHNINNHCLDSEKFIAPEDNEARKYIEIPEEEKGTFSYEVIDPSALEDPENDEIQILGETPIHTPIVSARSPIVSARSSAVSQSLSKPLTSFSAGSCDGEKSKASLDLPKDTTPSNEHVATRPSTNPFAVSPSNNPLATSPRSPRVGVRSPKPSFGGKNPEIDAEPKTAVSLEITERQYCQSMDSYASSHGGEDSLPVESSTADPIVTNSSKATVLKGYKPREKLQLSNYDPAMSPREAAGVISFTDMLTTKDRPEEWNALLQKRVRNRVSEDAEDQDLDSVTQQVHCDVKLCFFV